jgi:hypothetical protein
VCQFATRPLRFVFLDGIDLGPVLDDELMP